MRFSERHGFVPVRTALQIDDIDLGLRNKLWNALILTVFPPPDESHYSLSGDFEFFAKRIWWYFLKWPLDEIPFYVGDFVKTLRRVFFGAEWYQVYDLLEFLPENGSLRVANATYYDMINASLEQEQSGYRFVGGLVAPITSEVELSEIEKALTASGLTAVRGHLSNALAKLADRESPDYPNSLKESISAVESLCSSIVGKKATLGDALKKLEQQGVRLHRALQDGWMKMYGYTSDEDGVRHAAQNESDLKLEDALYFLVSCSAFVNLLTAKANGVGIQLAPVS